MLLVLQGFPGVDPPDKGTDHLVNDHLVNTISQNDRVVKYPPAVF